VRNGGRGDGRLTTVAREELNRLRRENRQLRLEREILSSRPGSLGREHDSTEGYRFVSENQAAYPIATMCGLLGVSSSGYYAWATREVSQRARCDAMLQAEIRAPHAASRGTYGAPRIHAELAAKGVVSGANASLG